MNEFLAMYFCMGLIAVFSWWTFKQWKHTPKMLANHYANTETSALQYISTPQRYLLVCASFCLLTTIIYWCAVTLTGAIYILATGHNYGPQLPLALACIMLAAPYLPISKPVTNHLYYFFQQRVFMPVLPAQDQEEILRHLMTEQAAFKPTIDRLKQRLPQTYQLLVSAQKVDYLTFKLNKLTFVHHALEEEFSLQKTQFINLYFNQEKELIAAAHQSISRAYTKLPSRTCTDSIQFLDKKIDICLFHCYRLLTRYIFFSRFSQQSRYHAFKRCGFDINVKAAYSYLVAQKLMIGITHLLPQGTIKNLITELIDIERRHAIRTHIYQPVKLSFEHGMTINADSIILSQTGAAIRGATQQSLGSSVTLQVKGFTALPGTLIRKNDDNLCVSFSFQPLENADPILLMAGNAK